MKTYFCTYENTFTKRQFIVAAPDEFEAHAVAYASEVGTLLDGTKVYPEVSDFHIVEILGCSNHQKKSCIIQKL